MFKHDYDIYSLLGKRFNCPYCKREHYIPTELVESAAIKGFIYISYQNLG